LCLLAFKVKKTLEGIFQQARGYDLKSHGRSVANVTGEGIGNTARAVIFGKSYDSGRRDYLENIRKLEKSGQTSKAGLNEKESASFRRVLDSEGIDSAKKFYNNTLQTNMAGVEKSQEMKNIMSGSGKAETDILGNEVEKRSFMQKIGDKFSKKEPVAGEYLQDIDINQLESTTVKSIRQNITKKEELGQEISDKEYEVRYLYDYNKMESDTNSQKIKKDREAFKIAKSMDGNDIMSDEQKEHILNKLEINKDELEYYQMAGEHDDVQSEYIRENILSLGSEEEVMEYLISQRAKVGGEQVLTDTIIGKLVEEGILDKQTGKNLKAITFVKDNDYDGDDYIMIGDSKYKPVVRKSTSSGSGSSAKSRASTSYKAQAQAWGSIRDILAKQKSINNQGIQNKAVTNQYTRRSLGNSLRQVNPDNQETRLLSQILQQTRQKREAGRPKNNILI
jgi:predicted adenine nucleotide alpha hydrolase (AANH) superfamily ATPase